MITKDQAVEIAVKHLAGNSGEIWHFHWQLYGCEPPAEDPAGDVSWWALVRLSRPETNNEPLRYVEIYKETGEVIQTGTY